MRIIKLALTIFLFQALFLICVSFFSEEISLSALLKNIWSKFIYGQNSDESYNTEGSHNIWVYLFFSLIRSLCTFATAKQKRTRNLDGIQTLQFLLILSLSCYLFFLDIWLVLNKGFFSYFTLLPIFSFCSLALDFNLLVGWIGSGVAFIFQLFCTLGIISMFFVNKGSYWLFLPYIMIPAFDILKTLFQSTMKAKFDSSMYLEQLLPTFFIIAYVKPLGGTEPTLYPPETKVVDTCGVFLVLGLLLVIFEKVFSQKRKMYKMVYSEEGIKEEDACSICLESLLNKKTEKAKNACELYAYQKFISFFIRKRVKNNNSQILKTPCSHFFHKKCLEKWFQNKVECPYCRNELEKYGKLGQALSF